MKFMFARLPIISLIVTLVPMMGTVSAQLTQESRGVLLEQVEAAKTGLDANLLPKSESIRADLLEEIKQLKIYFDRNTDEDNREAWMDYLQLAPLVTALESGGTEKELVRMAVELRDRLIGTVPGLELTVLQGLRESLGSLISALRFQDTASAMKLLESQLTALSELIQAADEVPTPDQFSAISLRVDLLTAASQASELIESMQQVFGEPNLAVRVSEDFLEQVLGQEISRTEPVKDVILGTRLTGTAEMTGEVTASLLPSASDAQIEVRLSGTVDTTNDGVNGPVRLKSQSKGQVNLSRVITIDEAGVQFGETKSDVSLVTKITDMTAKSDLALRVGKKQSVKKKPQADRIAKEKLKQRVTDQFESEMEGMKANASSRLLNEAKPVLERLSLSPPKQSWSTSEEYLALDVMLRSASQLSAVNPPGDFDLSYLFAAQLHESVIENAFTVILAGRTLDKDRLNELLENAGAPQAEAVDEEEAASFEISFSRSRPVIFEARDGKLKVGIRGTRFAQGDRTPLNKAMEITASYEVVRGSSDHPVLKRVGDVEVAFPRARLSIRDAGLKPIIQKEFSKIFPEMILDQSIQVAQDAEMASLRGRQFRGSEIKLADGWLSIAFQ